MTQLRTNLLQSNRTMLRLIRLRRLHYLWCDPETEEDATELQLIRGEQVEEQLAAYRHAKIMREAAAAGAVSKRRKEPSTTSSSSSLARTKKKAEIGRAHV